tara:strand:- start:1278 stop:1787 length:510 start_codon:yes stop_codon:yes gene_type:complete
MEDKTIDKLNLTEKILNIFKEKRKPLFFILSIVIVILLLVIFFNYYQDKKNKEISEKYIKAGIYLSSQDKKNSKLLYEEIILSKNKFYSILALNNIIENNLEEDKDKILNFFKIVEKIDFKKEKKNLIKLKKGLYLINISKDVEGKKLLNELIKDDSIWKNTAIEISTK